MQVKHQITIVYLLLFVYTLPIIVTIGYCVYNVGSSIDFNDGYFKWMATLARSSSSQLNLFHKILLPIVAGISALKLTNAAVAQDQSGQTKGFFSTDARMELIVYCIVVIVMALIVTVVVSIKDPIETDLQTPAQDFKTFIASISDFVGVYLMLLLGLKAQS